MRRRAGGGAAAVAVGDRGGVILAIDPGLANTGIVLLDDSAILDAWTLRTKRDPAVPEFEDAVCRSQTIARGLRQIAAAHLPEGVPVAVVESYKDIPGHLRGARRRWTTPLCIGILIPAICEIAEALVWQDPETVMCASKAHLGYWAAKKSIHPGDERLTNEHLRSAGAHGLYYQGRRRWSN